MWIKFDVKKCVCINQRCNNDYYLYKANCQDISMFEVNDITRRLEPRNAH